MQKSLISLFSGAMGLDLGLNQAGFETLVVNEIDLAANETTRHNCPDLPILSESVSELKGRDFLRAAKLRKGEVDLVAGGPPCQSFSVYGNRDGAHDPRGRLIYDFVRLIDEIRPLAFAMENVRGLHSMPLVPSRHAEAATTYEPWMSEKGSFLRDLRHQFFELGYRVDAFLVNAANYGAPQVRERLFLIGNRFNVQATFPEPQFSNRPEDNLPPFKTLRETIGENYTDRDTAIMDFSPRKLKYLAMVPEGGNWRSLPEEIQRESMGKSWHLKGGRSATWRRLAWDSPSPTVVTMPNHASTSMCHPSELRALTVGECASIQEFPRAWRLKGTPAEKYRQIGNAVPVRLGHVVGEVLAQIIDRIKSEHSNTKRKCVAPCEPQPVVHIRPHIRINRYWHQGKAFSGSSGYYDGQSMPLFDSPSLSDSPVPVNQANI